MSRRRLSLSDQIRRSVDTSGLSRYRICKELGMSEATMSRFMSGEGGLSMRKLDALAGLLGLEISVRKRRTKGR